MSEEDFRGITQIMLNELKDSMADKDITFTWDDKLVEYLTHKSYSLTYGARNLRLPDSEGAGGYDCTPPN